MKLLKAALVSCTMFLSISALLLAPASSLAGEAELKAEIDRLWSKVSQLGGGGGGETGDEGNWSDKVTISGVVEVEAGVMDTTAATESDIAVATVELGIEAEISDFSSASILLLYEDEGTLDVDEAMITIGNTEKMPLYLTAGKMYVPFGNYESQMISDPMTLELGEAQEDAILVGVDVAGFYSSVYTFNGDTNNGGANVIEHYGANIGYAFESDAASIDVGAGWISSIRDSGGLFEATYDASVPDPQPVEYGPNDFVGGYAAHLVAGFGPVTLIGEYVAAADDIDGTGTQTQVSAFNLEVGVSFPIGDMESSAAVGFQKTDEAFSIGVNANSLPEERIVAAFSMGIMDGIALAVEWLNDTDYDVNGGEEVDVYTLQLAAEF